MPCETRQRFGPRGAIRVGYCPRPFSAQVSGSSIVQSSRWPLPKVQSELGVGFEASQWIANAYLLTLASPILFGGSVGDAIGQRRTFILGLAGFAAASIASGIAPNAAALVIFRGLQGAAGAFLIPASLALSALHSRAKTVRPSQRQVRSQPRSALRLGDGWLMSSDGAASSF